jgi:hypothetical protein
MPKMIARRGTTAAIKMGIVGTSPVAAPRKSIRLLAC